MHCDCESRRRALIGFGGLALAVAAPPARAAEREPPAIVQPATPSPVAFMRRAFELRRIATERGDQPYGAVIVRGAKIVGEGVSAVITTPDPTAHAEMQAIRDAARRLRTPNLSGCEMYGTSRACPMCEAGAYWAGLLRLWYGESIADGGGPRLR
jgi:tRNA(Arg) A34 adenosine deaminase TadA